MPHRCQATNQAGLPCQAAPWQDGWCRFHHPDLADERREWSAKGGRGKSNAARAAKRLPAGVMSADDLRGVLGVAIGDLLAGTLEPKVATALAGLVRASLAAAEASAIEALQGQVDELRALAEQREGAALA